MKLRTKTNTILGTLMLAACGAADAGGGSADHDGVIPVAAVAAEEKEHTLTILHVEEDGTLRGESRTITSSEQQIMLEREKLRRPLQERADEATSATAPEAGGVSSNREPLGSTHQAITRIDPGCGGASLWLYSEPSLQGDMLCMHGRGYVDLSRICRTPGPNGSCSKYWTTRLSRIYSYGSPPEYYDSSDVRSFWAGQDFGGFYSAAAHQLPTGLCSSSCKTFDAWSAWENIDCASNSGVHVELGHWGNACWAYSSDYYLTSQSPADVAYYWTNDLNWIANDDSHWFISQESWLVKVPLTASLDQDLKGGHFGQQSIPPDWWQGGNGWNHIGDIDFADGLLYLPMESETLDAAVGVMDADLNPIGLAAVPSPEAIPRNMPWLAVNPVDGLLYIGKFDLACDSSIAAYERSFVDGQLRLKYHHSLKVTDPSRMGPSGALSPCNAAPLTRIQGGAFSPSGQLYLSSDAHSWQDGGIYGVDVTGQLPLGGPNTRLLTAPIRTHIRYQYVHEDCWVGGNCGDETQGIDILDAAANGSPYSGQIHVLLNDNNKYTDKVYFKHYDIHAPYRL
jgi:hypothetical protein